MYEILLAEKLNGSVMKMVISAPLVAKKCLAGQFIILRVDEVGERIPLTIFDYDRKSGTVSIIFQIVGATTRKLSLLKKGDYLFDFVGPLGNPTNTNDINKVLVIGGGVGTAIAFPICKELYESKKEVDAIAGFRNKELVILEDDFRDVTKQFFIMTDDGSYGEKGLVTEKLEKLILSGSNYERVYAIGPLPMMKFVSKVCDKYNIPVIVSMNSIMIDGTGMCGCCRLLVDGKVRFACIDGPEFDGTKVDYDEAIKRNKMYFKEEREKDCNLLRKIDE